MISSWKGVTTTGLTVPLVSTEMGMVSVCPGLLEIGSATLCFPTRCSQVQGYRCSNSDHLTCLLLMFWTVGMKVSGM